MSEEELSEIQEGLCRLIEMTRKPETETLRYLLRVAALEAERLRETGATSFN